MKIAFRNLVPAPWSSRTFRRASHVLTLTTWALCMAAAAALIHSAWCAFTWCRFDLFDYGIYTNMIWNSGHGRLFRFLLDQSYLRVHLSFTLALLGPFFHVWNHPFLLSFMQWLMLVGGCGMILLAGRRHALPACATAAVVFLYLACPFTQTVILCEFHGVGLYFFLLPWLYYCLSFKTGRAWVPLVLSLGVREDAFLTVLPMVTYFAVLRRDRTVLLMAAATILYAVAALFLIYPAINGESLFAARAGYLPHAGPTDLFTGEALTRRLRAIVCVLLPCAFLLRNGWKPILAFVALPLMAALAASSRFQYELKAHYPAAVMVCLALGIFEALARSQAPDKNRRAATMHLHAVYLVIITLTMHLWRGYLPLGGKHKAEYARVNPKCAAILDAARHVPGKGLLMCSNRLAVFCANRADMDVWTPRYPLPAHRQREPDLALFRLKDLRSGRAAGWIPSLTNNTFSLIYTNKSYAVVGLHSTAGSE